MEYGTMVEPPRIARLPHQGKLPITYTTQIRDGKPDFKSVDLEKAWDCKKNRKCSICGEPLDYYIAFMVDEKEAWTRLVYDNPNHEECLRFAFNICPWLYYSKSTYSDTEKLNARVNSDVHYVDLHPNRIETLERPPKLGIYICRDYKNVIHKGVRICRVGKTQRIEWMEGH